MVTSVACEVALPGGLWVEGRRHRNATLRPLSGADELFARELAGEPPPAVITALLARCLDRLGPVAAVTPDAVAGLAVGDREALTWHLRRLTTGDRVQGVVACPAGGCGEKLDLDLWVTELLLPAYPDHTPDRTVRVEAGGVEWAVRFRLPTGADQAAVADLARQNPTAAADRLLERCVLQVTADDRPAGPLPAGVADRVAEAMAEADPQAEVRLALTCPACGRGFESLLDAAGFVTAEVLARGARLLREVHTLARAYHWSETDILGLTPDRRRTYLTLIADEAERRGG